MNTPAHIIFSLSVLGPSRAIRYPLAIVVGALIPDLLMMVFYAWHKFLGTAENLIWSYHYFLPEWQAAFDLTNSIPLIVLAMIAMAWRKSAVGFTLFASMLVHCVLDLLVHHDDGHRHFYPFNDWRYSSPVSYWDPAHFGDIVGMIEVISATLLSGWLWWAAARAGITDNDRQDDRLQVTKLKLVLVITMLVYLAFYYYVVTTWVM